MPDQPQPQLAGMTPTEAQRATRRMLANALVYPDAELDALQILMSGPDLVEVKARLAVNGNWYQGFVPRREWGDGEVAAAVKAEETQQ